MLAAKYTQLWHPCSLIITKGFICIGKDKRSYRDSCRINDEFCNNGKSVRVPSIFKYACIPSKISEGANVKLNNGCQTQRGHEKTLH